MRAIICTKYGGPDVVELRQIAKPVPKDHELLVQVRATTVTTGDCRVRGFQSPWTLWIPMRLVLGIRRPRNPILGVELAGIVESVGRSVTKFKPGDAIFAMLGMKMGAHAEYVTLREDGAIAAMPTQASFEDGAALAFGGTTALHFLRKAQIGSGSRVMIYGASGAVGTSAVQVAKIRGAKVTAVCSGANRQLALALGADDVIDYTVEDFTRTSERYDIVFDAVGKTNRTACRGLLAEGGRFVSVEGQGIAKERAEDLDLLREWYEAGKLRAVIDRTYQLEQMVEAYRYVETGRKKGNVVVQL